MENLVDEELVGDPNSNDFMENLVDEEVVHNPKSNDIDEPHVDEIDLNIFEPSVWDGLSSKMKDLLKEKGLLEIQILFFQKMNKIDISLVLITFGSYEMVNPMIENGWFIPKIWIKFFVFVANCSKLLDQKVN